MEKWYFTFGVGTALKDKVAMYEGSYEEAREKMCNDYGSSWSFQYSEEEMKEQFEKYGYRVILDNKACGKKHCIRIKVYMMLRRIMSEPVEDIVELIINDLYTFTEENFDPEVENKDIDEFFLSNALFNVLKERLSED